ncbi:hypothetical protein LIER_14353 [Lithospermum erythrorhizon]|uniref:Uncharacterized protein n=1 Tax=Lithospermum erythrorhizon TaxID=34254 RepID=A0AAV3Q3H3_LITER
MSMPIPGTSQLKLRGENPVEVSSVRGDGLETYTRTSPVWVGNEDVTGQQSRYGAPTIEAAASESPTSPARVAGQMKFPTQYGMGKIQGSQKKLRGCYLASTKRIKAQEDMGSTSERPEELKDRNVCTQEVLEESLKKGRPHEEIRSIPFDEGDPPKKEALRLTGSIAALTQFISCVGDLSFSFFKPIKKGKEFEWAPSMRDRFKRKRRSCSLLSCCTGSSPEMSCNSISQSLS